jgi:hypothetical protein
MSHFAASAGFDYLVFTSNITSCNAWLRGTWFFKAAGNYPDSPFHAHPVEAGLLMLTGGDFDNF